MADYWKSNPRKFCEVCKCWMADNKISVQNHEGGMRHKSNVAKKMNELMRSNKDTEKNEKQLKESIQKINDAAFVGMMKDLQRDPTLAKRYGVVLCNDTTASADEASSSKTKHLPSAPEKSISLKPTVCEWQEATAPDGRKYYWNTVTRVAQWERPACEVAPEVMSVKAEKDRLQHFVLNRLVELSESGSRCATEAVHEAFNAPMPDSTEESTDICSYSSITENTNVYKPEQKSVPHSSHGPRIDLLGPWTPVEDEPPVKLPKLDLPGNRSTALDDSHKRKLLCSATDDRPDEKLDSKQAILNHLEATTEESIQSARLLEIKEKSVTPGSLSSARSSTEPIDGGEQPSRNAPRLVFRRGLSSISTRSFRTATSDE
ncbi:unnamed protein product [Dicrocoelium dendriticum]|nr:unnamed protein product [Dicrocoelium dendriticum]